MISLHVEVLNEKHVFRTSISILYPKYNSCDGEEDEEITLELSFVDYCTVFQRYLNLKAFFYFWTKFVATVRRIGF